MGPSSSGAFGAAQALEAIPNSKTVALLQQERQQMIVMSAASRTLTVVAQPKEASPASAVASANQAASAGTGSMLGSTTGSAPTPVVAPNPGTAQSIAYNLLASFGFATSQFSCLQELWNRESGWSYDAENPTSGAYGIPQALPGSKMASAGADWQTNPKTQIEWGLGYIKDVYGSPCAAWNSELANGAY
jgi:resuscitation-promoting factor RpfB